jgi:hypothetical protein
VIRPEGLIYMVLEYGEIDLAHLLTKQSQKSGGRPDGNFVRHYWQQVCVRAKRWVKTSTLLLKAMGKNCLRVIYSGAY